MFELIFSEVNKKLFLNGLKSLGWRTGAFAVVGILNLLVGLNLPVQVQIVISLLVSELTKFLNKKYQLGQAKK